MPAMGKDDEIQGVEERVPSLKTPSSSQALLSKVASAPEPFSVQGPHVSTTDTRNHFRTSPRPPRFERPWYDVPPPNLKQGWVAESSSPPENDVDRPEKRPRLSYDRHWSSLESGRRGSIPFVRFPGRCHAVFDG